VNAQDLAAMRSAALEQLVERATIRRYARTSDDWGHRQRSSGTTVTLPCASGEITVATTNDPGILRRTTLALLLPHDAAVSEGDEVLDVQAADGSSLGVRGRVARVMRTPTLVLVELGGA
jgi:hypothetical protein